MASEQTLKTQAFHAHRDAKRIQEALRVLGADSQIADSLVQATGIINEHFNPPDVRRMQHGDTIQPEEAAP